MVWPGFHAAYDWRIGSEVLLHGTQATVLDRGASLDDAGDRGGSTLGRLLEGVSRERARCPSGVQIVESPLIAGAYWAIGLNVRFARRSGRMLTRSFMMSACPRQTGDEKVDGSQRPDLTGVRTQWEQVAGNGAFPVWISCVMKIPTNEDSAIPVFPGKQFET